MTKPKAQIQTDGVIKTVKIENLHPNPHRPPKLPYDSDRTLSLVEDYERTGMWPTIIVAPIGDVKGTTLKCGVAVGPNQIKGDYYIVMGHHRVQAAMRLGLTEIRCIVRDLTSKQMLDTWLAENSPEYRKPLVDEWLAQMDAVIKELNTDHKLAQSVIYSLDVTPAGRKRQMTRFKANGPGVDMLMKRLGWNRTRVAYFLAFLRLGTRKKVDSYRQLMSEVNAARAVAAEKRKGKKPGKPAKLDSLKGKQEAVLDGLADLQDIVMKLDGKQAIQNFRWQAVMGAAVLFKIVRTKWPKACTKKDLADAVDTAKQVMSK